MKYPKRLIEVDLPIKRISAHARREKSIRHGHISTLHIWWARRPLAACRAVICASLWPDPADELCPQAFRDAAAEVMFEFCKAASTSKDVARICSEESWAKYCTLAKPENTLDPTKPDHQQALRYLLLDFIADGAAWEASTNPVFLDTARKLTQAAHEALGGAPGTRPLVVDPFAGGGAIPLEALRMGADAFASDLNPVAVLLNKVVLEYIPKYGKRLADEVRKWGQWVKEQAEKELSQYYPKDADGSTPIAYLWARTITCEGPGCGAEVPMLRSLWLCKRKGKHVALKLVARPRARRVDFELLHKPKASDVGDGTVARGSVTCPVCGYTTPVEAVRTQLKSRGGGARSSRLFCVVTCSPREKGRQYRLPTSRDEQAAREAEAVLSTVEKSELAGLPAAPEEPLPPDGTLGFRVQKYGMLRWGDLFGPRQLLAMLTFCRLIREAGVKARDGGLSKALAQGVQVSLALAVDRLADKNASLTVWNSVGEKIEHVFGRQALPMTWDYPEVAVFSDSTGNWMSHIDLVAKSLGGYVGLAQAGTTEAASATDHPLPDDSGHAFVTDPPYYDAVPYSALSNFFYVWLRRTLPDELASAFAMDSAPCATECIVDETNAKDRSFFENTMATAMAEGRRVLSPIGVGLVVFAHKSTSGWETQLQAMVDAGWIMTGSWPIDTERPGRLRAQESAALASSVHIVVRPRENEDGSVRTDDVGDWREVLQALPVRIHEWMPRLASEGVVGADAIFACLGPALEIFSRYSRVEKASGEQVTLREYLEHVWAAVSQEALRMVFEGADASGFEEDARLTAMWLWTLGAGATGEDEGDPSTGSGQASGKVVASTGYGLEFDAARKIAQGLGAHLEQLDSVVEIKGDKARLLAVSERAEHLMGKGKVKVSGGKKPSARKQRSFAELSEGDTSDGDWGPTIEAGDDSAAKIGQTALDRVHQAMLLFAAGRSEAFKRFLVEDGVGRDSRFWTLAQALSALYPANTDEKRWVDGVLARKKNLGF